MSDTAHEKITEFIKAITASMRLECEVAVQATEGGVATGASVVLQVPEDANLLIGRNGQNLQALEHVVRAMLARHSGLQRPITIDVNDYRKTRSLQLVDLVKQAVGRVRDTRKPEALPPMTSYERRIVHTELSSCSDLASESVGQDPQRRVVIKLL